MFTHDRCATVEPRLRVVTLLLQHATCYEIGVCFLGRCDVKTHLASSTKFEGKSKALHLCSRCQKVDTAHVEAARVAAAKKKYAPISWAEVPPA